jgi:hypothetical protein
VTKSRMFLMNFLTYSPMPTEIMGYRMTITQSSVVKLVSERISLMAAIYLILTVLFYDFI